MQRLALMVCGVSSLGAIEVGRELELIPVSVLENLVDETDGTMSQTEDRVRLLGLLGLDPREQVRADVARSLTCQPTDWAASARLIVALVTDPSAQVRREAASALAAALQIMAPFDRPQVIANFATSPDPRFRLALARALARPTGGLAEQTALHHLAADPVMAVRVVAARTLAASDAGASPSDPGTDGSATDAERAPARG